MNCILPYASVTGYAVSSTVPLTQQLYYVPVSQLQPEKPPLPSYQEVREELGEKLKKYLKEGRRVTFLGEGVPVHKTKITEEILPGEAVTFAPANMNRQRAASVGTLGMQYYKEGKIETAMEHEPEYLRVSQAERERKERMEHV